MIQAVYKRKNSNHTNSTAGNWGTTCLWRTHTTDYTFLTVTL